MARNNPRLEAARKAYRDALEAARADPTPEAWTRLLGAGKELSSAQEPRKSGRRPRRGGAVIHEMAALESVPDRERELESLD